MIRSARPSKNNSASPSKKTVRRRRFPGHRAGEFVAGAWAALALALGGSAATAADTWLTDFDQALVTAAATGRPVLAVFTGSDWCTHCRTLENQVLNTGTFRDWARDRVVLVVIDLPRQGISSEVRRTRSRVCTRYGVRAFPSILLADPDGTKLALRTGYRGEPPATWMASWESLLPAERPAATSDVVFATLEDAVARSRTAGKPVLVMVSRAGDTAAEATVRSLIQDPDFKALARENFVVATVPHPTGDPPNTEIGPLLDGIGLSDEAVGIVVTEDGKTPLFSHSGQEPSHRIVTGLRRFLASLKPFRR